MDLGALRDAATALKTQVARVVMGQDDAVDLLLVALLAEGHVLLEGVPGTAKTLLARTFAASLSLEFKRIQFTPDLLPGDILGTTLFDFQSGRFNLTKGPIFTQILLADEINRTAPKTQSALLEAMQERTVTLEGKSHELGSGFMVIATQNPLEHEGTYPLPEAQLDRFLFKIPVGYPGEEAERDLVRLHGSRSTATGLAGFELAPIVGFDGIEAARAAVRGVRIEDDVVDYVVALVRATREDTALSCGASPRAAANLASASRARAALEGRDFVLPDDVKALAPYTLPHRVVLSPAAEIEGASVEAAIAGVVERVPAPR